jgi:hypothetical protein
MIFCRTPFGGIQVKKTVFLFFIGLSTICCLSISMSTINLERIPYRKVRKYIAERGIDRMNDFSLIHASCKKETIEPDLNVSQKVFYLKYSPAEVWNCYRNIDPLKTWNRKSLGFGLMISKSSNYVTYIDNTTPIKVDTGQVYFLNLRLLIGLLNIPVAFEIINIDENRKVAEYSYIDNSKARGKHVLEFLDDGNGGTKIVHRSYFKSESSFRDKFLYPIFHKKFIKEFHRNMRQTIQNESVIQLNFEGHNSI